MNEDDRLRIGDAEREAALQALGEHLSAGRLDVDEYGERSARITAAKTAGELAEIFADLPTPHPAAPTTAGTAASQPPAAPPEPVPAPRRDVGQRITSAAVPVFAVAGIVLFFVVGGWWWFLLPAVVMAVGKRMWGPDWHHRPHRPRGPRWHGGPHGYRP